MHSLRTKITAMTVCVIIIAMTAAAGFGIVAIKNIGRRSAEAMLLLLCETGEKNLDHYLESVKQSVEMVSAYVESDLHGLEDGQLQAHLNRVSNIFQKLTYRTYGVLTYYYRIDPRISNTAKGFWYTNLDGEGFRAHEVTDIARYDTEDTSSLVWFTVPKATGEAVWLPPYVTDNLDARVISYNVPVYYGGTFVGVIGIEIDCSTIEEEVNHITLYDSGCAFLCDAEGSIIYHPRIDPAAMEETPAVSGVRYEGSLLRYSYDGVEKQAARLPLSNGMQLIVTVPIREINSDWWAWCNTILLAFSVLLFFFIALIMTFTGHITKPLRKLTAAAEQIGEGNYDLELDYDGQDEVGILTRTIKRVTAHLKVYISDLSDLAFADALTSVRNKGAFDIYVRELEESMREPDTAPEFAVCIFDCNNLKQINDNSGHEKGDIYLKQSAAVICEVFSRSPVFRTGGDEFAALLMDRDYRDRNQLLQLFDSRCAEQRAGGSAPWEKVSIARGMALYDPQKDESVSDVVRRADKIMYENKWKSKHTQASA